MNTNTFLSLLSILFIGLKLANIIQWPWVWVLAPILITFAIGLFCLFLLIIYYAYFESKEEKVSRIFREMIKKGK